MPSLPKRYAGVFFVAVCTATSPLTAQDSSMPPSDSVLERARHEGAVAANRHSTIGHAAASIASGLVLGYMLPITLREGDSGSLHDPETRFVVSGMAGLAISFALASRGTSAPAPGERQLKGDRSPEYRDAYQEGFARRLRERRQRAVLLGGIAGSAAGFGLLYLLVQLTDT